MSRSRIQSLRRQLAELHARGSSERIRRLLSGDDVPNATPGELADVARVRDIIQQIRARRPRRPEALA